MTCEPNAPHKGDSRNESGVLILFDIIDSTKRKEANSEWLQQTQDLYHRVGSFSTTLIGVLGTLTTTQINKPVGDAVLLFFPIELEKITPEILIKLLVEIDKFRASIMEDDGLSKMGLKAVATICKDVVVFRGSDILGTGVDEAFRLETYAGISHIIINNEFKKMLGDASNGYGVAPCKRQLKGIGEREFFALANIDQLENTIPQIASSTNAAGVMLELFQLYMESKLITKDGVEEGSIDWEAHGNGETK